MYCAMQCGPDRPTLNRRRQAVLRPAFTLVEMMIVVAIIATLAGLLGAAVMKMIPAQVRKNTENTIRKTNALLQRNWKAVIDQASAEAAGRIPVDSTTLSNLQTLAGNDKDRLKAIWIKLRLKQQFPTSYAEARAPGVYNGTTYILPEPAYGSLLKANDASTEMAACLLLALTAVKRSGVNIDVDALSSVETRDTDRDGFLEIVDGWGVPLGFFRWPRGNSYVDQLGPPATFRDSQDPLGRLQVSTWLGSTSYAPFQNLCHPVIAYGQTPAEPYTLPVICSAGPDGPKTTYNPQYHHQRFGYKDQFMDLSPTTGTASYDNINSYDLK